MSQHLFFFLISVYILTMMQQLKLNTLFSLLQSSHLNNASVLCEMRKPYDWLGALADTFISLSRKSFWNHMKDVLGSACRQLCNINSICRHLIWANETFFYNSRFFWKELFAWKKIFKIISPSECFPLCSYGADL